MSAALNGLGNQLLAWLGPLSIELAALALLVLAAGRLIRSPALRHLLWLAVLVKPLVAVAVSSPYTVFAPLAPLAEPGWDAIPHGRVEHLAALAPAGATTVSSSATLTPAGWAALLWLVGTTLFAGRILVGFGVLRRMRRQATVQREGPLFEALRQARAALDCHPRVEVATSSSIRSPMVVGILRPLILVPTDLVDRLRADALSLVLMHELAHVRRCDNLALLLQRLVSAALFFHPAVWLCARMLRRESEQACDDLVVCATGRAEAYARGLTLVAEAAAHSNLPARRIPMMSTFASTESDLSQRIRRTLKGQASRMGVWARALAVGLVCPLAAVTMPSYGAADNGAGGETAAVRLEADSTLAEGLPEEATATDGDEVLTIEELAERIHRIVAVGDSGEVTLTFSADDAREFGILKLGEVSVAVSEEEIDTEGVRNRIVAVADSQGVTRRGAVRRRELIHEAIARAMEVEEIEREAIERVTAETDGLSAEETLHRILEAVLQSHILQRAVATDPDEWSDELKTRLLALEPNSTVEEIAVAVRNARDGSVVYGYSVGGEEGHERENLFLVVDQDGNMELMKDKPVTLATLGEELKKQRSLMDSTSMIIIQVDKGVSRSRIVKIMDIAQQVGLVDQIIAERDSTADQTIAIEP